MCWTNHPSPVLCWVELFQQRPNFLFREFFIVDCVQRFHRLLSDGFAMSPVSTLDVLGYTMFHHLVECAFYVIRLDVVSGFES
jgi:hypothetical protein